MSQGLLASYAVDLLQALLALVGVCVLAVLVLRVAARRGWGVGPAGGAVQVVQRIALEPRRSLYVVRAGERVLLVGISEGGGPVLLAELDPDTVPARDEPSGPSTGLRQRLRQLVPWSK